MQLSWDQDRYLLAYNFAANAHKGQPMKGKPDLPYIIHPSLVSMEVIAALQAEQGLDGNLCVQCALLHDVIEDCHVPFENIKITFGEKVALGVLALSKTKISGKSTSIGDYLHKIQEQPREVWMVKLADRITNLQPPPRGWSKKKIGEYRLESIEILNTLGSASSFLAVRLRQKIEKYGQKE
jgi:(p)ppGpp synthase/HD superfamily hydrolase